MAPEPIQKPGTKWTWGPDQTAAAITRLQEFIGTPHMHRRAVPGVGVDCINLVAEALKAAGVVEAFELPPYRRNDGYMADRNHLEDLLRACLFVDAVDPGDHYREGDLIVFAVDRSINHVGIFFGGRIWHAAWNHGTIAEDAWSVETRVQRVLRIRSAGFRQTPAGYAAANPDRFKTRRKHR